MPVIIRLVILFYIEHGQRYRLYNLYRLYQFWLSLCGVLDDDGATIGVIASMLINDEHIHMYVTLFVFDDASMVTNHRFTQRQQQS